jgi:MerR family mercuric resistance operon transcriptional regulator
MEAAMESLTIGQVARAAGVGVETVRFYEREGLIAEPPRRASGYRQYPPEAVRRIRFIKRAKELGFTLKEVRELLSLRVDPDTTCGDVRARAEAKTDAIGQKIHALQRMKDALVRLTEACVGSGPTGECPILEALDQEDDDADR